MADPLTLLREFNKTKKDITEGDGMIHFLGISFNKTAKTNYVICRTTPKEYYTLEALLFLLRNVHLSHPIYVQRTGAAKVPAVRFPDRKDLLAYLNGEKDTSPSIDKSAPLELPLQKAVALQGSKRPYYDDGGESSKKRRTDEGAVRPDIKEWLAAKLMDKKEGTVTADKISKEGKGEGGLNTVMSVEKIAEIKRKFLTRKRGTIKGDDELEPGIASEQPSQAYPSIPDMDTDVTKDIIGRERLLRTRTSVLQSSGKQFMKSIMAILQSVKAVEEGKGGQQKQPHQQQQQKKEMEATKKPTPAVPYNRYDQERFGTQIETEGFKIDTQATFHGLSLDHVKEGKSQRRVMASPSPHQTPNRSPRHSSSLQISSGKPPKRESKTPIIIVPAGTTSLISLLNVKDFLQDFKFLSTDEKKRQGAVRENEVLVQRKKEMILNGQLQTVTVPFRVVDQPLKLNPSEWNRVVAVFVQGPMWQFKGWPWLLSDGSPVDIFTKVKGFHIKFEDMKIDPNVQKWDVQILTVNRNRRHFDRACILGFWEYLDKFLLKNKPNLRF